MRDQKVNDLQVGLVLKNTFIIYTKIDIVKAELAVLKSKDSGDSGG